MSGERALPIRLRGILEAMCDTRVSGLIESVNDNISDCLVCPAASQEVHILFADRKSQY